MFEFLLYCFIRLFTKDKDHNWYDSLFPAVMTPEAERFLQEYNKQHGHLDPFNAKPFVVDGKTYKISRIFT